jgi:hypothetical protein
MTKLPAGTRRDPATERVLFALVANRALDPASKLAAAACVSRRVHIDGLPEVSDDACCRAMDWLIAVAPELEKQVFWQVATLLDPEVDVLFFDTTSTYFTLDEADEPITRDTRGLVPADNYVRAGQAACSYSWRMPPRRSRRWMLRWASRSGSVIDSGNGASGRAFAMP